MSKKTIKEILGDYKKVKHEDLVEGIQKIYDLQSLNCIE